MPSGEPWRNPRPAPQLDEIRNRVPAKELVPGWIRAWWPAAVWAAIIFWASTDSFSSEHTSSFFKPLLDWIFGVLPRERFEFVHHVIRKSAHFTEYFIFALLLFRGIRAGREGFRWTWALLGLFIAAAYAALDEVHQSFVASRTASPWDSLLDTSGAAAALLMIFLFYLIFGKTKPDAEA